MDLDAERLSLLYRLCIPAVHCRVLEVSAASAPILRGANWAQSTIVSLDMSGAGGRAREFPFRDGSFDAVVLHRALDRFGAGAFLSRLSRLLVAGGIIAGCSGNRHSLKKLFQSAASVQQPALSVNECRAALASAGFGDLRLFSVVPGLDSPRKLLSIEGGWSRRASRRHVEALRPLLSRSGYWIWRTLAEIGVSQHLGSAIFFSGRREC